MADLDEIYNTKILEFAAAIPHGGHLGHPDATATAHSKLCGSTVSVDIEMNGGRFTNFAQTVKACLLGQATASIVGREIIGSTPAEIRRVGEEMRRMLKENGPPPTGERWADLAVLEPARHYKARHASVLLIFEAVDRAVAEIEAARKGSTGGTAADAGNGSAVAG
jgi:NifU-like protein involved in Fe-S cluster formation